MPPKVKTEQEKQQFKTLVIDAARHLFVTKGVDAVSMREIAKGIGYSATSIYSYYADKEAVLRAVCDTDFLALASSLTDVLKINDPVGRMVALGTGYAQFALSHPSHYRIMFMTPYAGCDPEQSSLEQNNAKQDAYMQLKTAVIEVHKAGRFRKELTDIDLIAQTVWAGMHGVCSLQITLANDAWFDWAEIDGRLTLMQNVLLRGLIRE